MKNIFLILCITIIGLQNVSAQNPKNLKSDDLILYIKQSDLYNKAQYIREELIRTHSEASDFFLNESMNDNENAIKLNHYNSAYSDLKESYNKFLDLWAYNLSLKWKYDMNAEVALQSSLNQLDTKLNTYKESFSTMSNNVAFGGITELLAISGLVVELVKFVDGKYKDSKAKRGELLKANITEPLKVNEQMISIK